VVHVLSVFLVKMYPRQEKILLTALKCRFKPKLKQFSLLLLNFKSISFNENRFVRSESFYEHRGAILIGATQTSERT